MASNINTTNINESYPVAGVDNDSQGFRDNFSTIKNNFVSAKSEIEDLQDNTAKTNANNNFFGYQITGAELIGNTETLYPGGTINQGQNISFSNGHVQTFSIGADMTLTLSDWPEASKVGKMRVMLLNDGTSRTVTWAVEAGGALRVSDYSNIIPAVNTVQNEKYKILLAGTTDFTIIGASDSNVNTIFTKNSATPAGTGLVSKVGFNGNTTMIDSQTDYTIIDFMTIDGGTTVFAEYKGQFAAPA